MPANTPDRMDPAFFDTARTVLLCGVGGQGTILASDLLACTASDAGLDVKMSEIHGMSQRGGSVTTIVRIGKTVHSMVCDPGTVDYLMAFETTEALRNISFLKEGGYLLVNEESIKPLPVLTGKLQMPHAAQKRLADLGGVLVPAFELARKAGNTKCANVVLLGALAAGMPFAMDAWEQNVAAHVPPKTAETNIKAFRMGVEAARA